jgi:hypothetical protein
MACCKDCEDNPNLSGPARWFSPSPTVRAPRTPLYQLGWLGDDGLDPSTIDVQPDQIPYVDPTDTGGGIPGFPSDPTYSQMVANPNLIPTTPTSGTGPAMGPVPGGAAPGVASSLTSAISSLFSPAPKVATTPTGAAAASGLTASLGSALPVLAIAAIAMVVLTGSGGRRRR